MARPRKEIDQTEFEKLCGLQCTKEEICGWFDITDKTLDGWVKRTYGKRYSEIYALKRSRGKISLRRAQFRLAEKNATMAIWLGKQYLGQREHYETDNNDNDLVLRFIEGMKKYDRVKREADGVPREGE